TPGTNADHAIIIFDLPGIDLIHFFATVLLTGPFCRTVVLYCLLGIAASGTNGQLRFVWVGSDDHPFPAPLFTGFCFTAAARSWLLGENRHPQRTHQRGHEQQIDNSFQFAIPPFLQTTNSRVRTSKASRVSGITVPPSICFSQAPKKSHAAQESRIFLYSS